MPNCTILFQSPPPSMTFEKSTLLPVQPPQGLPLLPLHDTRVSLCFSQNGPLWFQRTSVGQEQRIGNNGNTIYLHIFVIVTCISFITYVPYHPCGISISTYLPTLSYTHLFFFLVQACNYIPIMDNMGAGFDAHTSYTIYHVCIICLWSLVGCTTLIHEPYTASMFPNAMRRKRHFFWICQLSQLLGQDLLSLALWVSHPVKLQSELQDFVWILNLQLKKPQKKR